MIAWRGRRREGGEVGDRLVDRARDIPTGPERIMRYLDVSEVFVLRLDHKG